jgi:hypothetical protein
MRLLLIIYALIISTGTFCQPAVEADRTVLITAKRSAQSQLTLFRDTLSLTKRQAHIRRFSLDKCQIKDSITESRSQTPKGEFLIRHDCPGIYFFSHKTNNKGSYYEITFFFDSAGDLRYTNISWILVVN